MIQANHKNAASGGLNLRGDAIYGYVNSSNPRFVSCTATCGQTRRESRNQSESAISLQTRKDLMRASVPIIHDN